MNLVCTSAAAKRGLAELVIGLAIIFGIAGLAHCNSGCQPFTSPAEIDAAYRAETVGCSVKAKSLPEAKACRKAVNKRYGLCERLEWPRISPCDD